jgi:hypothetical protein
MNGDRHRADYEHDTIRELRIRGRDIICDGAVVARLVEDDAPGACRVRRLRFEKIVAGVGEIADRRGFGP